MLQKSAHINIRNLGPNKQMELIHFYHKLRGIYCKMLFYAFFPNINEKLQEYSKWLKSTEFWLLNCHINYDYAQTFAT